MQAVTLTENEQFFNAQLLTDYLQERQPQDLKICGRWRQSQHPWSASPLPLGCRDVPSILLDPAYKDDSQVALYLIKPLQVGTEKWSQVWEGSLCLLSASSEGHQPARVVVKLFQESYFPRSWLDSESNPGTGPTYGAEHAKREAWAYSVLHSMQGKQLPWSYGTFLFELPELTYGHVMEFIDGEQGGTFDFSVEKKPPESFGRLIDYTISTLVTINQLGVTYNDVRKENMLYRKADTRHPFVFIDFGSAEPSKSETQANDCLLGFMILHKMGVGYQALRYWHDENRKAGSAPLQIKRFLECADKYFLAEEGQPEWIERYNFD